MTKSEFIERHGEEAYQQYLLKCKQYYTDHKEQKNQYRRHHYNMFAYCIPDQIEQIENYQLAKQDNFNGWEIHHRLETDSIVPIGVDELKVLGLYFNRPASELIFLKIADHTKLHHARIKQHKAMLEQLHQINSMP